MDTYPQVHVQVSGRTPAQPAGAPGRQSQSLAVVHAGGHLDDESPLLAPPAFAPAVRTGGGDLLSCTPTARAGRGGDHLPEDRLAHPSDLAGAVAHAAGDGCRPRPGAAAEAGLA